MLAFYLLPLCTFTSSVAGQGSDAATNWCPPLGPALPPPRSLRMDSSFEKLMDSVGAVTNNLVQQLGLNNTAVSLAAQSIHDAAPFFSHQITPQEMNPKGVRGVTEDTIFRIGSVSKVFTVLAILKAGVALSDPVTHYLPELFRLQGQSSKDPLDSVATVDWTSVTIDALTSQLAGISGQCSCFSNLPFHTRSDLIQLEKISQTQRPTSWAMGYLPSQAANIPNVGEMPQIELAIEPVISPPVLGCFALALTLLDFFAKFAQRRPVYAPYTTPVYSNEAYALLGWVIESATNMTYGDYLQENVFEPLGMAHSSLSKPDDSHGFLAVDEDYWPTARGLENP